MLHVANGDAAAEVLRAAGLPGEISAWSDTLDQGPLAGAPGTEAFRSLRARFLTAAGCGAHEEVVRQLEAWDRPLLEPKDETVLWFESDLNCQLALVHHALTVPGPASIVVTEEPVSQQQPAELRQWLSRRMPLDTTLRELAWEVWNAVTAADPRQTETMARAGTPPLVALAPALQRLLEELPAPRTGLSRTEREALEEALRRPGCTPNELFRAVAARERVPYVTDFWFFQLLDGLRVAGLIDASLHVTPEGEACLRGERDRCALFTGPRDVGGVRISGPRCFRWDGSHVVAP